MDVKVAAAELADARIASLAAGQHGVLSTHQLATLGVSRDSLRRRVEAGRLHRLFHGVFAVGHPGVTQEGRWIAAVLACRGYENGALSDAFLSHLSAARLLGLLPSLTRPGLIDVAVIGENGRSRQTGLRIHRPRTLEVTMTTQTRGIPVTDPTRTLSDLKRAKPSRGGATPAQLRRAMRQAAVLGMSVGPDQESERTRSDLEVLFLKICERHTVPIPEVNVKIGSIEVDFLWRGRRLIVETDSYRYHRGEISFQDDHARDLRLTELEFRVLRFSEIQLEREPARVAALVLSELRRLSRGIDV